VFENVLHQDRVIRRLKLDITNTTLPAALLFHGEPFSGKLTTALELARVLTCEQEEAAWGCTCRSCEKQRLLVHPATVMLGNRYFMQEITACGDVLKRNRERFAQYMFVRSVRKLTRRFDADFSGEGKKSGKTVQLVRKVEELLEEIGPGMNIDDEKNLDRVLSGILETCGKISGAFENSSIPIDQIRKAAFWVHTSVEGLNKVVILENVDQMLTGSKNALLKTLEEPPENVYFILITSGKNVLLPTVLSRVRPYRFIPRDNEASSAILKKIFREKSEEYMSLKDYFQAWDNIDPVQLKNLAGRITGYLLAESVSREETASIVAEVVEAADRKEFARALIEETLSRLKTWHRTAGSGITEKPGEVKKLVLWNRLLNDGFRQMDIYNQRPKLVLEHLLYTMREV